MTNLLSKAIAFAKEKHKEQNYDIDGIIVPYFYHCLLVKEIFSKNCSKNIKHRKELETIAILHDIMEDCNVTHNQLADLFGEYVAGAVSSLSKNKTLPKQNQIPDSVKRIKNFGIEVGAVKMANRI